MNTIPRTPKEYRQWWQERRPNIPYGYCWCDCGNKTTVSRVTTNRYVKGEPKRFLKTHAGAQDRSCRRADCKVEDRGFTSPCWVYQGAQDKGGYCKIYTNGRSQSAQRVFYEERYGPIPEGLQPDHLCRVRACVNPDHIEPVTPVENTRRRLSTKLSLERAREIRSRYASGRITQQQLADLYEVHVSLVNQVILYKIWRE